MSAKLDDREMQVRREVTVRDGIAALRQLETALSGSKRLSVFDREALTQRIDAAIYDLAAVVIAAGAFVDVANRRLAEAEAKPTGICTRCHATLTRTPQELRQHIESVAKQAYQHQGWPVEAFVEKVSAALEPGDEIVWLIIGGASVRRRDGSGYVVWRADS